MATEWAEPHSTHPSSLFGDMNRGLLKRKKEDCRQEHLLCQLEIKTKQLLTVCRTTASDPGSTPANCEQRKPKRTSPSPQRNGLQSGSTARPAQASRPRGAWMEAGPRRRSSHSQLPQTQFRVSSSAPRFTRAQRGTCGRAGRKRDPGPSGVPQAQTSRRTMATQDMPWSAYFGTRGARWCH